MQLLRSAAFVRAARKYLSKHPKAAAEMEFALQLLSQNVFDARLKTHKLKGEHAGSWACSAGYDLRIVFEFVAHEGAQAILLQSIGSHEAVY